MLFRSMTEMLTLIQTKKIPATIPLVVVGKEYWKPFLEWVKQTVWKDNKFVSTADLSIIQLVDTAQEAFDIVKTTQERPFG